MESRRVQKVGYSTLSVSLPSRWVKEAGLKQGDIVLFIQENDGSLRVITSALAESKKVKVDFQINSDLCDEPRILERIIIGNYILGRDTIIIFSPSGRVSSEHLQEIREATRRLMGVGIIEETPNRITLQCSIDPAKFPIDTLMRRLYVIASTMYSEALQALSEDKPELAQDALRREDEADMLYWLIIRLLLLAQEDRSLAQSIGISDILEIPDNRAIVQLLESIADHAEKIAISTAELVKFRSEIPRHLIESILQIGDLTSAVCQKAMDCNYKRDIKVANDALEAECVVESAEERLTSILPKEISNPYILTHLRSVIYSLRRIAELGATITLIAIDKALEKPSKLCAPTS
ncbi:MAG: phosphate uptake regulator PhoU [Candidatus Bathyarchaeia archaeon]